MAMPPLDLSAAATSAPVPSIPGGVPLDLSAAATGPTQQTDRYASPGTPLFKGPDTSGRGQMDPKQYLKGVPKQVGDNQIDGLNPLFAQRLANFTHEATSTYPTFQISAGYDPTGQHHHAGSLHYQGLAADVVPDWNFVKNTQNLAQLQAMATKHGLHLLDEWGPGSGGGQSHFHLSLPSGLPAADQSGLTGAGHVRSGGSIETFVRGYAMHQGVDPDIAVNLMRTESNMHGFDANGKPVTSPAGAVGIGQMMPDTAATYLRARGKTWDDYLQNENLQVEVSVDHMKDLLTNPKYATSNGDYAKMAAAYNAGEGGLQHFQHAGRVDYLETRKYVANVLGIKMKDVDAAVLQGGVAPYDPAAVQAKAKMELPTQADISLTAQMSRNIFNPNAADPQRSPYSVNPVPNDPIATINQSAVRHIMQSRMVDENGTVDDSSWAADNYKHFANEALFNLPGVFMDSMRTSKNYEDWRLNASQNWATWADLKVGDFFTSLPLMLFGAETLFPKAAMVASRFGGELGDVLGSGIKFVGEQIPSIGTKLPAGASAVGQVAGYLTEKGLTTKVAGWSAVMGFDAMNRELQNQFEQGKNLDQAWPYALSAGVTNAAFGGLVSVLFPAVGGTALAFLKGAFGARQAGVIADAMGKLRSGDMFGDAGPKIAALADGAWDLIPQGARDWIGNTTDGIANGLKGFERNWFMSLVKGSDRSLEAMDRMAKNESAHAGVITSFQDQMARLDDGVAGINSGIDMADKQLQRATSRVNSLQQKIQDAENSPLFGGDVQRYKASLAKQEQIQGYISTGQGPNGQPLSTGKAGGQDTLKYWEGELKNIRDQIADLKGGPGSPSSRPEHPTIKTWEQAKACLTAPNDGLAALTDAQSNSLVKDRPAYEKLLQYFGMIRKGFSTVLDESQAALAARRVPDYAASFATNPITPSVVGLTAAEKAEFSTLQTALIRQANAAVTPKAGEFTLPVVQRVLQDTVYKALQTAPGAAEAVVQRSAIENAVAAIDRMSARASSTDKAILKVSREKFTGILDSLKNTEKYTPSAIGTAALNPSGNRAGGAASAWPRVGGVLENLMGLSTEAYPNGIPASVFAKGGDLLAALKNPTLVSLNNDSLAECAAQLMSDNAVRTEALLHGAFEDAKAGIAGGKPVAPYTLLTSFSGMTTQLKHGLDAILQRMAQTGKTTDGTFGQSFFLGNALMGVDGAAKHLASTIRTDFEERILPVLGLKKGQSIQDCEVLRTGSTTPDKFGHLFSQAIEGGRQGIRDFLNGTYSINGKTVEGSKFFPPMQMYLEVQSAIERFKIQSPEMAEAYRDNYFMHVYPRQRMYLGMGDAAAKRFSSSAEFEKARTIPLIKDAIDRAAEADAEIKGLSTAAGKPVARWEDYVYGMTPEQRAAALNVSPKRANELLGDVLLGDPLTDPGAILQTMVASSVRADASRHMMTQLQMLSGPEGAPLLVSTEHPRYADWADLVQQAKYRPYGTQKAIVGQYEKIVDVPGMGAFFGNKTPENWLIHPQVSQYVKKYLTSPVDESAGPLKDLWQVWRGLSLISSPLTHMFSIMSNRMAVTGWNMGKAMGLIPLGEMVAEENPILLYRSLAAGLLPTSIKANIRPVTQDLLKSAETNPDVQKALQGMYGTGTVTQNAIDAIQGAIKNYHLNPVEGLASADHLMNRVTMFKALSDSQVGAWVFHTNALMEKYKTELMGETGGSYSQALSLAERYAAEHVNQLSGSVPYHYMSDRTRNFVYAAALAPQYMGAKMDVLLDAFDGVTRFFGARSKNPWAASETLSGLKRQQVGNFLIGSLIAGTLGANAMNYLINGSNTFSNPPGHELDIRIDNKTFVQNPFFGMFRPFFKAIASGVWDHQQEKTFNYFMNQLHPFVQTIIDLTRNSDRSGNAVMPRDGYTVEGLKALTRKLAQDAFDTESLGYREGQAPPGMGLGHQVISGSTYGIPMTGRDWALQLMGANPSFPQPIQIAVENNINKERDYSEQQMSKQVRVRLELYQRMDPATPEAREFLDGILKFATTEGIPSSNPEMKELYKAWHPQGNYVEMNAQHLNQEIESYLTPYSTALAKVPEHLRVYLRNKIDDQMDAAAHGYLQHAGMESPGRADIDEERTRREYGYFMPFVYNPPIPFEHPSNASMPGSSPIVPFDPYVQAMPNPELSKLVVPKTSKHR